MNINGIISYYNNLSFLDLIKINELNINWTVYNKSGSPLGAQDLNYKEIMRENVGRETETYLNHIISNYNNLSDYTLFIQDDVDEHLENYESFLASCVDFASDNKKFYIFPTSWRKNSPCITRTMINGNHSIHTLPDNCIAKACKELNIDLPPVYITNTCAFFICHKDVILKRSKVFYENALDFLLQNELDHGFAFEHMWEIIFNF